MAILTPPGWIWDRMRLAANNIGSARPEEYWGTGERRAILPAVRRIGYGDLKEALRKGVEDFTANRTDVIFICLIYPVIGLLLGRLASGYGLLPLVFPMASGFALVGPAFAVGLNEMSRQRELGQEVSWTSAFHVLRSPSIGGIVMLALLLVGIFLLWDVIAEALFVLTLGPEPPASVGTFIRDVFTTWPGIVMIILGVGIGFLFAVLVLVISVVSFPLLLDRDTGIDTAVRTSLRVVGTNPDTIAMWGLIVAGLLVLGTIPFFVGLAVVLPVLGHATWHLYRAVIPR